MNLFKICIPSESAKESFDYKLDNLFQYPLEISLQDLSENPFITCLKINSKFVGESLGSFLKNFYKKNRMRSRWSIPVKCVEESLHIFRRMLSGSVRKSLQNLQEIFFYDLSENPFIICRKIRNLSVNLFRMFRNIPSEYQNNHTRNRQRTPVTLPKNPLELSGKCFYNLPKNVFRICQRSPAKSS